MQVETKLLPEALLAPEQYPFYDRAFSAVAPSELHALTYGLLVKYPEPRTSNQMYDQFMDAQGMEPAWADIGKETNFKYAQGRFANEGLVKLNNEIVVITTLPEETRQAAAICGALLCYGLTSSPSLYELFGGGLHVTRRESGVVSRRNILQLLLEVPNLSTLQISEQLGIKRNLTIHYLDELVNNDILFTEGATDWSKRIFRLNGKPYSHMTRGRDEVMPETRALLAAADILVASGQTAISAEDLFRLAQKCESELDIDRLREKISHAMTPQTELISKFLPMLEVDGTFNEGYNSRFIVNSAYKAPLNTLMEWLKSIEKGDDYFIGLSVKAMQDILKNPAMFNMLVEKARKRKRVDDIEFIHGVETVITSEGPVTVKGLTYALKKLGIHMSIKGVNSRVARLSKKGKIITAQISRNERTTATMKYIIDVSLQTKEKDDLSGLLKNN